MRIPYRTIVRLYSTASVPALVLLSSLLVVLWIHRSAVVSVHFLDVGQGDSIYVRLPDGVSMLIDGGPDNHVLDSLGHVMPWWDHSIDYVVITHPDRDHFAGLLGVAEKYDVGTVLYNGDQGDRYYEMMLDAFRTQGSQLKVFRRGDALAFRGGITMRFVWPPDGYVGSGRNDRSLVALLSWRSIDFLLTGDMPDREEELMLRAEQLPKIEVLKVGHHGSAHSTGEQLLSAIRPSRCVISAGADNAYGHPAPAVLERLADAGCHILETMRSGTITLMTDGFRAWQHLPRSRF
ncbi:MAG: MBL fold metallo-hydrolase [Candidatus Komeilibacteria bacterium]|nr:MBL fold metallo-hydrolase [Candidatus Komeilibacteria bacterium]